MKRFLKFGVLALVLVFVAGCEVGGGKKLTCTYKMSANDNSAEYKYVFTFNKKGDEITKAEMSATAKYDDKDDAKDAKEEADDDKEDYEDIDGVTYKTKLSGKTVSATLTANVKKIDEDDFKSIFNVEI